MRVLVVEDEVLIRFHIKMILNELGFEVVAESSNGYDAIRLVKTKNIDLVLMDYKLGNALNGAEAALEIRKFSEIPLLFISAFDRGFIEKELGSENNLYFTDKPITREKIESALANLNI